MTQDEAIKRASIFLQKILHDDEDAIAFIREREKEKDVEGFIAALDQIRLSCEGLKQIISNQKNYG